MSNPDPVSPLRARYGERYRESFIDELARYHGAPRDLVRNQLAERRLSESARYVQ